MIEPLADADETRACTTFALRAMTGGTVVTEHLAAAPGIRIACRDTTASVEPRGSNQVL